MVYEADLLLTSSASTVVKFSPGHAGDVMNMRLNSNGPHPLNGPKLLQMSNSSAYSPIQKRPAFVDEECGVSAFITELNNSLNCLLEKGGLLCPHQLDKYNLHIPITRVMCPSFRTIVFLQMMIMFNSIQTRYSSVTEQDTKVAKSLASKTSS